MYKGTFSQGNQFNKQYLQLYFLLNNLKNEQGIFLILFVITCIQIERKHFLTYSFQKLFVRQLNIITGFQHPVLGLGPNNL